MRAEHKTTHSPHGSRSAYHKGFILSAILTAIPFWLVMSGVLQSRALTATLLIIFAMAQIVVHMIYFLHMDARAEREWIMLSLIFTIVVLLIAVSGSLWIMYHLNTNMMMPMDPNAARNMP